MKINKKIAEHFSVEPRCVVTCKYEKNSEINNQVYPDFTAQVEVACKECGGYGKVVISETYDGVSGKSKPCPTCQGKLRKITLLQKLAEEKGTWEAFLQYVYLNRRVAYPHKDDAGVVITIGSFRKKSKTLTDANSLYEKYYEWMEVK